MGCTRLECPEPPPIFKLLDDSVNPDRAIAIQERWQAWIASRSCEDRMSPSTLLHDPEQVCRVAGVDVSYPKDQNPRWGIACAALWDVREGIEIARCSMQGVVQFPYIPGLLGFREAKLMVEALHRLPRTPDLIMCDGHGIAHPRRFGEAVHVGAALGIPSIGLAKELFHGYCDWKGLARTRGTKVGIYDHTLGTRQTGQGELLGYAICLTDDRKPVFISAGYRTIIDVATAIALQTTTIHRQPEPLYLADRYSRAQVKNTGY